MTGLMLSRYYNQLYAASLRKSFNDKVDGVFRETLAVDANSWPITTPRHWELYYSIGTMQISSVPIIYVPSGRLQLISVGFTHLFELLTVRQVWLKTGLTEQIAQPAPAERSLHDHWQSFVPAIQTFS